MDTYIYTDGSKIEMDGVAAAGIYCEHFAHYLSLETSKNAFHCEVEAIKIALVHLDSCPLSQSKYDFYFYQISMKGRSLFSFFLKPLSADDFILIFKMKN